MDIYAAVFSATIEDIRCARSKYVKKYGHQSFKDIILPYASTTTPGHIFSAPESLNLYFYLDALAACVAFRRKETYEPPYQFLAVFIGDDPPDVCPKCGLAVRKGALIKTARYPEPICLLCFDELVEESIRKGVDSD